MTSAIPRVLSALVAHEIPVMRVWDVGRGSGITMEMQGRMGPYMVSATRYDVMAMDTRIAGPHAPKTRDEMEEMMLLHCRKTVAIYRNKKSEPIWIHPKIAPGTPISP